METVYLSWLARPRKWRCCLTDTERDVKESLRTTSFLPVTTFSVSISEYIYTPYACRAWWRGGSGPLLWIERSRILVSVAAGLALYPWARQFIRGPSFVHSQPRSEWGPGWTAIACVFECVFQRHDGSWVVYAPQGAELVLDRTNRSHKFVTMKNWKNNYYLAIGCKLSLSSP